MGLRDRTVTTVAEYEDYRSRLSNWGRWGIDDQFGTLNHITPDARQYAASLVQRGRSISCANPIATQVVVPDERRNRAPADHQMRINPTSSGSSDYIGLWFHGFVNTHIDALCHVFTGEGGQLYNGVDPYVITETGAISHSIDRWQDGIVTRGVLYDIPRMRGHDYVRLGDPVEGWDLEGWAKQVGVTPRPGDAVLVRSGATPFWEANPDFEMQFPPLNTPGLGVSCLEYLYDNDAAFLAWDQQEASGQDQYGERIPVHAIAIPHMGMPLLDNANLEALAEACAETGRYEFLFVVSPLVVLGGTGSPVNPIAIV